MNNAPLTFNVLSPTNVTQIQQGTDKYAYLKDIIYRTPNELRRKGLTFPSRHATEKCIGSETDCAILIFKKCIHII